MNRLILIVIALLAGSCQSNSDLFDDITNMVEFEETYSPTLIQAGTEDGFLEPVMEYNLYKIDSTSFTNLKNSILTNHKFKEGKYYLNIELDDYLQKNKLDILNMSKSLFSENHYDRTYHLYLLSDRKTFAICKLNH